MKVVKINALGCPSCMVMENIFDIVKKIYKLDVTELDYDTDDTTKYSVGKVFPVYIFYKGQKEVGRIVGEKSKKDFIRLVDSFEETK